MQTEEEEANPPARPLNVFDVACAHATTDFSPDCWRTSLLLDAVTVYEKLALGIRMGVSVV